MKQNIKTFTLSAFIFAFLILQQGCATVPTAMVPPEYSSISDRKVSLLMKSDEAMLKGEWDKAIEYCKKVISTSPKDGNDFALYNMSMAYVKKNDYANAKQFLDQSIADYPNSNIKNKTYSAIAQIHFLSNEFEDAIDFYKKAAESSFDDSSIKVSSYYNIGQCYYKLGNTTEAKVYFNKVKNEYPLSFESKLVDQEYKTLVVSKGDTEKGLYAVQTGIFKSAKNAKKQKNALKKRGYTVKIIEDDSNGMKVYKVWVGRIPTEQKAEKIAKLLRKAGYQTKIKRFDK